MDYNEEEDNIENSKRCSKDSLNSEHSTLQPGSDDYYADNRILIPETGTVRTFVKYCLVIMFYENNLGPRYQFTPSAAQN